MPVVLLRMTLSGGRAHGAETGQEGALAVPKTMCSSARIPLKYSVGQVLTLSGVGIRTWHAGIQSQEQRNSQARG